jgi:hypothetical protein
MRQHPYCTYLTVIIHEDLPFMYIGSGKTKDVLSGRYKGSVLSKEYKDIFNKLKKEQPHLIHSEVINQFTTREKAYEEEIKLHTMYDVARCPVFMNKARATTSKFACDGHTDETKAKMSAVRKGKKQKPLSDEHKAKLSAAKKGKNNPMFGKTGENHPMFGKTGENHPMFGKIQSEETKERISVAKKGKSNGQSGKKRTEETRAKMSAAKKGKKLSDETKEKVSAQLKIAMNTPEVKAKLSAARKGIPKPKVTCPHCGKSGGSNVMKRWHFDNCKNLIKEN